MFKLAKMNLDCQCQKKLRKPQLMDLYVLCVICRTFLPSSHVESKTCRSHTAIITTCDAHTGLLCFADLPYDNGNKKESHRQLRPVEQ